MNFQYDAYMNYDFYLYFTTFNWYLFISLLKDVRSKVILSLKSLQSYWGVDFPLNKLDVVALPGFSSVKPVDNWGLLVFK